MKLIKRLLLCLVVILFPVRPPVTAQSTQEDTADVYVQMTDSPDPVILGSNLTYTLIVVNNGKAAARNVVLSDALPALLAFQSAAPPTTEWSCAIPDMSSAAITCTKESVEPGEQATFVIVAKTTAIGVIQNAATVTSAGTDPDMTNNTAVEETTVVAQIPQLPAFMATWK